MRKKRSAFTLLEIMTVIVITMFMISALTALLRLTSSSANRVVDMSLNVAHARSLDQTIDHLVSRAVAPPGGGIPSPMGYFGTGGGSDSHGIWFFANLDSSSNTIFWVWMWLDFANSADQNFAPYDKRYPIKIAAFTRRPPAGQETDPMHGANFNPGNPNSLYSLVNTDPNAYLTIASDCEKATAFNIMVWNPGGNSYQNLSAFGGWPGTADTYVLQVSSGFFIDRSLSDPPWNQLFNQFSSVPKVTYDCSFLLPNINSGSGPWGGWSNMGGPVPNQNTLHNTMLVRGNTNGASFNGIAQLVAQ